MVDGGGGNASKGRHGKPGRGASSGQRRWRWRPRRDRSGQAVATAAAGVVGRHGGDGEQRLVNGRQR